MDKKDYVLKTAISEDRFTSETDVHRGCVIKGIIILTGRKEDYFDILKVREALREEQIATAA